MPVADARAAPIGDDVLAGKRVVVTGATGFIGRRLVHALIEHGAQVVALSREPRRAGQHWPGDRVTVCAADLTASHPLTDACVGAQIVFHLAGHAHALDEQGAEAMHRRLTVQGTARLLNAARQMRVQRFVYISSVKAMGESTDGCLDEGTAPLPTTAYGRARLEAERLVLAANAAGSLTTTVLRLPLVYGPGNKGNLPRLIVAMQRGRLPPLPKVNNRRSMVHVDDVVQAALLAATASAARGQVYIVTDGHDYSTRQIYEWIAAALGRAVPRWTVPMWLLRGLAFVGDILGRLCGRRVGFDRDALDKLFGSACYSSRKLVEQLGYQPRHALEQEMPALVADSLASCKSG